jgi:ABC-type bacteriocin/lantibiotic exporter with double-glycine peptidase domain
MSIDAGRVSGLLTSINSFWSNPLTIFMSQYFLYQYLGVASLVGLAVMIIAIPIEAVISRKIKNLQVANLKNKDERIKTMNEMLEGIKVIKLYSWENCFEKKIGDIRKTEADTLKRLRIYRATLMFITSLTPFLVAITSFATFVLMDPENILTAQIAFVSISFYNTMRWPLVALPSLVVSFVQAAVSLKRVNDFMNANENNPNDIEHNPNDQFVVEMKDASFNWDPSSKSTLHNINLRIPHGGLVAIVGKVGYERLAGMNT